MAARHPEEMISQRRKDAEIRRGVKAQNERSLIFLCGLGVLGESLFSLLLSNPFTEENVRVRGTKPTSVVNA